MTGRTARGDVHLLTRVCTFDSFDVQAAGLVCFLVPWVFWSVFVASLGNFESKAFSGLNNLGTEIRVRACHFGHPLQGVESHEKDCLPTDEDTVFFSRQGRSLTGTIGLRCDRCCGSSTGARARATRGSCCSCSSGRRSSSWPWGRSPWRSPSQHGTDSGTEMEKSERKMEG